VHILTGLGGGGKTTVALAVSDAIAREGGQAWWLSARDRSSVDSSLVGLASALGVANTEIVQARAGNRSVLDLTWKRLEAMAAPWVLVIDNADSPELLAADGGRTADGNGVARGSGYGLTLVTSRNGDRQAWGDGMVIHAVRPLEAEDGADVLLDLAAPAAGSRADAIALAARLGGLPLALRAAGRYLSSTMARLDGVRTYGAYLDQLDARFAVLQGPAVAESGSRDIVMTTWDASLDLLAARGYPQARPFMQVIGQFAAAPIPAALLAPESLAASGLFSAAGGRPGWPRGRGKPRLAGHELRKVVAALASLALLDMIDYEPAPMTGPRLPCPAPIPCLMAHPLVVEVYRQALRQDKSVEQAAITAVLAMVSAAAQAADPGSLADAATWPLLAPHVELLAASIPGLPSGQVARFAASAERIAVGLRHGGDYHAALHLVIKAREAVGQLSAGHPAVLALRHIYAYVIDDLGRFEDAEGEYRGILAARVRSLGPRDPLTLTTRNHLAFALSRQGRFAEAEDEYRTVLEARTNLLGPEHRDTLTTRGNLADVLYGQQRYDEAEQHYEAVLQAQIRVLGPEHPRTLTTRNNLARNRNRQGKHQEAEAELRDILSLRRSSRGAEHPSTLATRNDLAVSLASQGRFAEARKEFQDVLESRKRILGDKHPDTMATAKELEDIPKQSGGSGA
jgi:tetratricopeptide (TPR) repeat protein